MVDQILGEFERQIDELVLVPSSGGVFEVTADGTLVYSKKASGRHAEYAEVAEQLRRLSGG